MGPFGVRSASLSSASGFMTNSCETNVTSLAEWFGVVSGARDEGFAAGVLVSGVAWRGPGQLVRYADSA
jgi:hypothetical protein